MSGRQNRIEVEVTSTGNLRFYDSKNGSAISEMYIQNPEGIANTVITNGNAKIYMVENKQMAKKYRIRKLTSNECYRLMGFTDKDYKAAESVISESQRYKTAGNAIVKQVLMAIFLQMGIQGKKRWNEMTIEERQNLVNSSLDFI